MKQYIFILGQNIELSKQEIITVIKNKKGIINNISNFFIIANISIKPEKLINILGGTIKILEYKDNINNLSKLKINNYIKNNLNKDIKNNFGFSIYNGNDKEYNIIFKKFLKLKKELKKNKYKIRLVTSKEKILSSVIISKNNLLNKELVIIKNNNNYIIGKTVVIQDFMKYGHRDINKPKKDIKSGMLPPKLAQIMINLTGLNNDKKILDPFCGSGTILQEAMLLGFKNIYGSDKDKRAIANSKENINWLKKEYKLSNSINIKQINVKNLNKYFDKKSIDIIVTEPFMGDARLIQKNNNIKTLKNITNELQILYMEAFKEFKKILSPNGKIVFLFPIIHNIYTFNKNVSNNINFKLIKPDIKSNKLSKNGNIIYSRINQKVKREITIWEN